ncbi:hypothetical protein [Sphingobacterium siyangense]|uniref:hypothetical protein n=1 Tax=Sphingobacterium siyangense TaxID=459529 RepID=UPI003015E1B9
MKKQILIFLNKVIDKIEKSRKNYKLSILKSNLKYIGENVQFGDNVKIVNPQYVSIGNNTSIDDNVLIIGAPSTIIKDISFRKLSISEHYNNLDFEKCQIGEVNIGENCHIGINNMLFGYGGITIDSFSTTSPDVKIYSLNSLAFDPENIKRVTYLQPYSGESPTEIGPVFLAENTWLGIGTIILPGTAIKKNSFVTSNSIFKGILNENDKFSFKFEKHYSKRFKI